MSRLLSTSLLWICVLAIVGSVVAGFVPNQAIDQTIQLILAFYLSVVFFRATFFFLGSFREKVEDYLLDRLPSTEYAKPMVSIIVPCYNEEKVIANSLNSLLNLDYPFYEIIVVNDGSTDSTAAIAEMVAGTAYKSSIQVISQVNQGKAAALNNGLMHAVGDVILCVDADSKILPGSLEAGIRHFRDPKVGAVAGFVEIANQQNWLLQLQQLEYLVGLNFSRRALSFMGVVPIVPGPAGLFRRRAIFQAGGFQSKHHMYAEDAELSLRILAAGWKVKSEEDLVAVTEAPEAIMPLLRQRYRWNRGTFQALMLNLKSLLFRSGWRGKWVGGYLFTESAITPVVNFCLILYFLTFFVREAGLHLFSKWYLYLLAVDILTTIIAVHGRGNTIRWIFLTFLNKVGFYYMLLTWRILSLIEEWQDKDMSWDKLERTGHMGKV